MKTAHEFARELLALPDIPVLHFDPSWVEDEISPNALTEPKAEVSDDNGEDDEGNPLPPFVCMSGKQVLEGPEAGDIAWRVLNELEWDADDAMRDKINGLREKYLAQWESIRSIAAEGDDE